MANANLIWITPDAEKLIGYMARVSNPANQDNPNVAGLIRYMIKHKHWSPFEMVSACFEIETTRDIARQILRHRSFSFQEFSQRYQQVSQRELFDRECRWQDDNNRQNSFLCTDEETIGWWDMAQEEVSDLAYRKYREALERGIAKEQARALLPEGLTSSRMYMSGTLRSWMHYLDVRCGEETQKEHREIAHAIRNILKEELPTIAEACRWTT